MNFSKFEAKSSAPLMSAELSSHQELLEPLYRASANLKGRFRASTRFRPVTVMKQIFLVQCSYWLTVVAFQLTFMTLPFLLLAGTGELKDGWRGVFWPSFRLLFDISSWTPLSFLALLNCICFLASAFVSGFYLKKIVGKSKKCLDFTLTCHGIHALLSLTYSRSFFPLSLPWCLMMVASTFLMLQRGRALCVEEELIPISIKK